MSTAPRPLRPFSAFNFEVHIRREGRAAGLCDAAFSECDGLDLSMDFKTLRSGGDNARQYRVAGAASFAPLTLKRGATRGFELLRWFHETLADPRQRADAQIVLLADNGDAPVLTLNLTRCLPVKLKTPPLNAREGLVAIEELQLVYETMTFEEATA